MGRVVIAILAIFLLLGAFATPILDGIKTWRTDDTTESKQVTTGGGVTSANVTLTADLFQDKHTEVISVSSNETETPIASAYYASGNKLEISALAAATTRTLTVRYYADTTDTVILAVGAFLPFLILGFLLYTIVAGSKKGKR